MKLEAGRLPSHIHIGRLAYGAQHQDLAALVVEASQQVNATVDDSPRDIAAHRADQHRVHLHIVRGRDTQASK